MGMPCAGAFHTRHGTDHMRAELTTCGFRNAQLAIFEERAQARAEYEDWQITQETPGDLKMENVIKAEGEGIVKRLEMAQLNFSKTLIHAPFDGVIVHKKIEKGTFLKVGFDYNSYENWLDMRNMIYLGMRYGASTFSQSLNSYKLYNTSTYFSEAPRVISGEKYDGLTSQWIEVVLGLKAEVLKNIYVGFSVRMNRLLTNTKPDNFDNLYIPGFNRTYNGDFGIGFNYSVSYFLPLYKTKSAPKPDPNKK